MNDNIDLGIAFDLPKNQSNVIKVIGVGGGGSNAINHMFKQGIKGVDFVICNTDAQALNNSGVPNKIQLGIDLTEGLSFVVHRLQVSNYFLSMKASCFGYTQKRQVPSKKRQVR